MKYLLIAVLLWGYNAGAQTAGLPTGPLLGLTASETPLDRFVFCACPKYNQYFRVSGDVIKSYDSTGLCKHVYVAVQSDYVKVGPYKIPPLGGIDNYWPPAQPTGKHEGQEIVCVKCHHVTKQVLDYGPPDTVKTSLIDWRSIPQFIIGQFTDTLEYVQSYIGEGGGGSSEFDSTIGGGTMRLTSPGRVWYVDSTGAVQVRKEDYKNWPESSFEVPTKNPVYDRIKSLQKRKKKK